MPRGKERERGPRRGLVPRGPGLASLMRMTPRGLRDCLISMAALGAVLGASSGGAAVPKDPTAASERLLRDSAHALYEGDYDGALGLLEKYFRTISALPSRERRAWFRFYSLALMGRVFLQEKQDPHGAIQWFERIEKSEPLSEAEQDIVEGWI